MEQKTTQYKNGNYTEMQPGEIVVDTTFGIEWQVVSNNGYEVALQQYSSGEVPGNGVKMLVSDITCTMTFFKIA